jgi:hypothetical protein
VRRRALVAPACLSLLAALAILLCGLHLAEGLLMAAPAVALLLPLLAGRYVGERALEAVRAVRSRTAAPRRRARIVVANRRRPALALVPRGGLLLAAALATRPPPALG